MLAAANIGLPLGSDGFANLSFEYNEADPTDSQHSAHGCCRRLIAAGNTAVPNPAQVWGQPEIKDSIKFFANTGFDISEIVELYAFGNYGDARNRRRLLLPQPEHARGRVLEQRRRIRCWSATQSDERNRLPDDRDHEQRSRRGRAWRRSPPAARCDAECFAFNEMFPGGFTPRFGGKIEDYSAGG